MNKGLKRMLIVVVLVLVSVTTVYAATNITKNIEVIYRDIKLVVDGLTVTPKDANGNKVEPFIYNGTTYLPVRAIGEALGKNVSWDGNTGTVYIGDNPNDKLWLLDECPPYESFSKSFKTYKAADSFIMGGKEYTNGFSIKHSGRTDNNYALFNLDGKYNTLEFDVGHIDGTRMDEGSLTIYLDGKVSKVIKLNPEELVHHVTVDLDYALQMKMEIDCVLWNYSDDASYGFANAELKK